MQAHNGHHLPSLFRASSSDDDEGGYDPWNDPRFHNDAPVHRGRVPIRGRNTITVSVGHVNQMGVTTREVEMRMSLSTRNIRALMKNPHLVQQFLESSLRVYRPSGPVRPMR